MPSPLRLAGILLAAALATVSLLDLVPTCHAFPFALPHRPTTARCTSDYKRASALSASSPSSPSSPSSSSSSPSSSSSSSSFFDELCSRFQGDFDNYDQVICDRRNNLLPREGGGHENIHCTLVPVAVEPIIRYVRSDTRQARLAAFYFDGLPYRIFRFRLYSLWSSDDASDGGKILTNEEEAAAATCGMTLYSLSAETEGMLRELSGRPLEWGAALEQYLSSVSSTAEPFKELRGCDVEWTPDPDPDRHAYAYGTSSRLHPDDAHHAVMVNGEATIPSMMNPGSLIRVVDELSLWSDDFWINDRGFDPDTGNFIYGNHRGVPYKMKRVTSLVGMGSERERRIENYELAWTLGDELRSAQQYEDKMGAIGGTSTALNASSEGSTGSKRKA